MLSFQALLSPNSSSFHLFLNIDSKYQLNLPTHPQSPRQMARGLPNVWLGNGEGPSGARKNPVFEPVLEADEPVSDDGSEAITDVAQVARVIRPPAVIEGIPLPGFGSDEENMEIEQILRRPSPIMSPKERHQPMDLDGFPSPPDSRPNASHPGKGKQVRFADTVTDIMASLPINNTEHQVTQVQTRLGWARLTNPAFVSRQASTNSPRTVSGLPAGEDPDVSGTYLGS
jgi:hypothetical protein